MSRTAVRAFRYEFYCRLSANVYGIDFKGFVVKDTESQQVFFQVHRDGEEPPVAVEEITPEVEDAMRLIEYTFPKSILRCATISTGLQFSVGPRPVPGLRMIERHYFKDKLVREYDMEFGFCIPHSTNTWEAQYDMPLYAADQIEEFVACPREHKSDSFYFVGNDLVMHHKATFSYTD